MENPIIEIINSKYSSPILKKADNRIEMVVYPRIHMFTFDLSLISGILRHGSFGYSLKNMPIYIKVRKSIKNIDSVDCYGSVSIDNLDFNLDFDDFRKYIKKDDYYEVEVELNKDVKEHIGLGLSTQILGGIYLCCAKISNVVLSKNDLFRCGIGHYSTLGLSLLFTPGFIIEMGVKKSDDKEGLIINKKLSSNYEVPSNTVYKFKKFPFYLILGIPKEEKSISGNYEIDFWNKYLPDKNNDSYRVVYNVFENIIPSIVEEDFKMFISNMNMNLKLGSKPVEERVQSEKTQRNLSIIRSIFGFGAISSLGPSLYTFSKDDPSKLLDKINSLDYKYFVYDINGGVKRKVINGETIIIASFACLGKTTFANENSNIAIDLESIHYSRIYSNKSSDDEVAKCCDDWVVNLNYPKNYIDAIKKHIGKYKFIFLTTAVDALSLLDEEGIKYIIMYPGKNRKKQIIDDSLKRGNSKEFADMLNGMLSSKLHINSFKKLGYEEFVIVNDDKYINDYIKENYIYE